MSTTRKPWTNPSSEPPGGGPSTVTLTPIGFRWVNSVRIVHPIPPLEGWQGGVPVTGIWAKDPGMPRCAKPRRSSHEACRGTCPGARGPLTPDHQLMTTEAWSPLCTPEPQPRGPRGPHGWQDTEQGERRTEPPVLARRANRIHTRTPTHMHTRTSCAYTLTHMCKYMRMHIQAGPCMPR